MSDSRPLSAKAQMFVQEYPKDLNGAQAAIRAGYSARRASVQAAILMRDPRVRAAVDAALEARAQRCAIEADAVLRELAKVVHSSVADFVIDAEGNVAVREGADPAAIRAVSRIKRRKRVIPRQGDDPIVEYDTEIALWDKNPAIEKAMKHLGILKDRVDLTTGDRPVRFTLAIGEARADRSD
jgi:phage terminase small subunit